MCTDCCFNLAATLAAAALIITGSQESWRGPHLVHRSLSCYLHGTKEKASKQQGKCGGKLQSSHASQEGCCYCSVGASAVWRRQRNWEDVLVYNACVEAEGWFVCLCVWLCVPILLSALEELLASHLEGTGLESCLFFLVWIKIWIQNLASAYEHMHFPAHYYVSSIFINWFYMLYFLPAIQRCAC